MDSSTDGIANGRVGLGIKEVFNRKIRTLLHRDSGLFIKELFNIYVKS